MTVLRAVVLAAYFGTLFVLAIYGCHRSYLLYLYYRRRSLTPGPPLNRLPVVTVQLPVYNERFVVTRLIESACRLEYPSDRIEFQVLDDSTDDTVEIAATAIARMRRLGHDIVHIRREGRDGYKAGALAAGLRRARGEFIVIFDADFVPRPGFVRDLIGHFGHPRVGMVQARWVHLNRDQSLLTRIQSMLLDGHFAIEHAARHHAGLFFNFNGTAGIWRRACIESAGGWQADTLTEDLDLSYRAQMAGWRFVFVSDVTAPGELPADMDSFRSQQQRWTRGAIQTGIKILPRLLRHRLPAAVKAEGVFHLTNNVAYLFMVLLALLIVPAMIIRQSWGLQALLLTDLPLFLSTTASLSGFYLASQREVGAGRKTSVALLPCLIALGIGISLNNARAVVGGLRGRKTEFVRTPKRCQTGSGSPASERSLPPGYRIPAGVPWIAAEAALGLYFALACAFAIHEKMYASLPFLALFLFGFLYAPFLSLRQAWERRLDRPAPTHTA